MTTYREIPGSHRREFTKAERLKRTNQRERVQVTVALSPDSNVNHAADLVNMGQRFGLKCPRRGGVAPHGITFTGSVAQMEKAFQVELHEHVDLDGHYRCRQGPYSVPAEFGSNIVAVIGLDTRPQARERHHVHAVPHAGTHATGGFYAPQVASAYGFPDGDGEGHSVGIIELGGTYQPRPMAWYFQQAGIASAPNIGVNGTRRPGQAGATIEVMLDSEIIASVVPAARTVIYFRPNTARGFYNAIAAGVAARHDAISISWGMAEQGWAHATMQAFENLAEVAGALGITITAASGDAGSSDGVAGVEVDFPAAAPHILACGGTNLTLSDGAYGGETVWNSQSGATGGGYSEHFPIPSYQAGVNIGQNSMRMVPDVAAVSDPSTGYLIRANNRSMQVGGTSAAAPLWAALVCRLNQALGRKVGFLHPSLYGLGGLRDIASGSNGAYTAGVGYDLCTGLGSVPSNLQELLI